MSKHARRTSAWSLALALVAAPAGATTATRATIPPATAAAAALPATETTSAAPLLLAAGEASGSGSLADFEKAQDTSGYNSEYIFALTRGLADSSIHPAGKVPLFIFTLPLDVVFLPFAAIAGLFG